MIANGRLSLTGSWSLGEIGFRRIVDAIVEGLGPTPGQIVEFGSGPSTARFAQMFPDTQVLAVEDSEYYVKELRSTIESEGFRNVTVRHASLELAWHGAGAILSYSPTLPMPDCVDVVIIDGPSAYTLRGREACMYRIYDHLGVGSLVFLDDHSRRYEKIIVSNWTSVYPDSFEVEVMESENEVAVLRKVCHVRPVMVNPIKYTDSLWLQRSYAQMKYGVTCLDNDTLEKIQGNTELFERLRGTYSITLRDVEISSQAFRQQDAGSHLERAKMWYDFIYGLVTGEEHEEPNP